MNGNYMDESDKSINNIELSYNDQTFKKVQIKTEIELANQSENKFRSGSCSAFFTFFKKYIIPLIFFLGWVILYLVALRTCVTFDDPNKERCRLTLSRFAILDRLIYTLASATTFNFMLILIFLKKIDKNYLFASIPIMLYLFYYHDNGDDNLYHGLYSRLFFYIFLSIEAFITINLIFLIKCLKSRPFSTIVFCMLICGLIYLKVNEKIKNSCNYWRTGFKKTTVAEDGSCIINTPKVCYIYLLNNLLDISKLIGLECEFYRNERELKELKYSTNLTNAKVIGLPRTELFNYFNESVLENIQYNVFKRSIDMDDPANKYKLKDIEVYINFTEYPQVVINLKKNETLIDERTKLYEVNKNKTMGAKNILYIYSDSLSRNHLKLSLPKTYSFFEENYKNPDSNFSSYQFLKYIGLAAGTYTWSVRINFN